MLSKYAKQIEICKGVFAIFNSLICEPVYVNEEELQLVLSGDTSSFQKSEIQKLYELGIYAKDSEIDKLALNTLQKIYQKTTQNIALMYIMPTTACNLACKYCFIGALDDQSNFVNIKWETIKIAVNKFFDHLKDHKIEEGKIMFYGGEPTIAWDLIIQTAQYIQDCGLNIKIAMVTNGTLLTEKEVLQIKKYGINFGISVDGPKDVTDSNRVFKGSAKSVYDKVMETVSLLIKYDLPVSLSVTISHHVLKYQEEIIQWLITTNASVWFNLLHFTEEIDSWENYYNQASIFLLIAHEAFAKHGKNEGRIDRKIDSFHNRKFKFADCAAIGGNQITICPNGDMCICHGYWNSNHYKCGNIHTSDFKDVFKTNEYIHWLENATINKEDCLNCEAIFICGGGCAMQAEALFGERQKIDRSFCIHTKSALKWLLLNHYKS